MSRLKVYCAGPLFNPGEQREMKEISDTLRSAGFETFLPQEDGLEFSKVNSVLEGQGMSSAAASELLSRAIFSLDVFMLLSWSDAVVANLNGRVPDEGTIVEAALAWHAGKAVVLYKDDSRTLLDGSDNPMCSGLGGFQVVSRIAALPDALNGQLAAPSNRRLQNTFSAGEQIAGRLGEVSDSAERAKALADLVRDIFG